MNASTYKIFNKLTISIIAFTYSISCIAMASKEEPTLTVTPRFELPQKNLITQTGSPKKLSRRRKASGNKKKRKLVQHMNAAELQEILPEVLAGKNKEFAIKCVERVIKLCTDINALPELLLTLANLYFEDKNFDVAARLYTEFSNQYPGSKELEFVLYRAILSKFNTTCDEERDQSNTHDTVALTDAFLQHRDMFEEYTVAVEQIRAQCYEKIVANELYICHFYLNQGNTKAVQQRISYARLFLVEKMPNMAYELAQIETELVQKHGVILADPQEYQKITQQLEPVILTENSKNSMKNRF